MRANTVIIEEGTGNFREAVSEHTTLVVSLEREKQSGGGRSCVRMKLISGKFEGDFGEAFVMSTATARAARRCFLPFQTTTKVVLFH